MFATTESTPVVIAAPFAAAARFASGLHAPLHLPSALALQLPIGCRA